jgi:SAM-dependent methyltransferase
MKLFNRSFFKKNEPVSKLDFNKLTNIEYNKNLWNKYAKNWTKEYAEVENSSINENDKAKYIDYLGDEWGDKTSVRQVIDDFIFPYINSSSIVAEIGSGGGRIAATIAPVVRQLTCFDISEEMINRAKRKLVDFSNIEFILSDGKSFDASFNSRFDFVYSFDVFVHLDLHTIWSYFKEIKKIINKNGLVFLHTTNLNAPAGWARFEKQSEYIVEGHYFISPEIIKILAGKAHYEIIKESVIGNNYYYNRDYLFILKNKV